MTADNAFTIYFLGVQSYRFSMRRLRPLVDVSIISCFPILLLCMSVLHVVGSNLVHPQIPESTPQVVVADWGL